LKAITSKWRDSTLGLRSKTEYLLPYKLQTNPLSYYVPVKLNTLESQTAADIPELNDRLFLADLIADFIMYLSLT